MSLRLAWTVGAVLLCLLAVACQANPPEAATPISVAPAVVQQPAKPAADHECNVYCDHACQEVNTEQCAYETSASCVQDCMPGCEQGAVKPQVQACRDGASAPDSGVTAAGQP